MDRSFLISSFAMALMTAGCATNPVAVTSPPQVREVIRFRLDPSINNTPQCLADALAQAPGVIDVTAGRMTGSPSANRPEYGLFLTMSNEQTASDLTNTAQYARVLKLIGGKPDDVLTEAYRIEAIGQGVEAKTNNAQSRAEAAVRVRNATGRN